MVSQSAIYLHEMNHYEMTEKGRKRVGGEFHIEWALAASQKSPLGTEWVVKKTV